MRIIEKGCDPGIKLAKFKFNCDECDGCTMYMCTGSVEGVSPRYWHIGRACAVARVFQSRGDVCEMRYTVPSAGGYIASVGESAAHGARRACTGFSGHG